jgi:hypothetical protein
MAVVAEVVASYPSACNRVGLGMEEDPERVDDIRLAGVVLSDEYREGITERNASIEITEAIDDESCDVHRVSS